MYFVVTLIEQSHIAVTLIKQSIRYGIKLWWLINLISCLFGNIAFVINDTAVYDTSITASL